MRLQTEDPLIDYQIRDLDRNTVEISKWDGSYRPLVVYKVHVGTRSYSCDCPVAWKGDCKHVQMVKEYIAKNRPATFPVTGDQFSLDLVI